VVASTNYNSFDPLTGLRSLPTLLTPDTTVNLRSPRWIEKSPGGNALSFCAPRATCSDKFRIRECGVLARESHTLTWHCHEHKPAGTVLFRKVSFLVTCIPFLAVTLEGQLLSGVVPVLCSPSPSSSRSNRYGSTTQKSSLDSSHARTLQGTTSFQRNPQQLKSMGSTSAHGKRSTTTSIASETGASTCKSRSPASSLRLGDEGRTSTST
jgi:hypothetical protein